MSKDDKLRVFPDVNAKLVAPVKKSVFERQREQAEAKRLKEQQETAAVYEDFVRSFDDEGSDDDTSRAGVFRTAPTRGGGVAGAALSKRHFSSTQPGLGRGVKFSGPGSLGPAPPAFARKRNYEGSPSLGSGAQSSGPRMFNESTAEAKKAFSVSDDEEDKVTAGTRAEERALQKPTIHMSSLPPGMSGAAIRAVLPSSLIVEGVRMLPPSGGGGGGGERRSMAALVTLAAETPASDLDGAVSALQNRYLGRGFYLSLSRHLSSAVIGSSLPAAANIALPFGAKAVVHAASRGGHYGGRGCGGYAPPPSLTQRGIGQLGRPPPGIQVNVAPPTDLKQLKLIHKMLELVISNGPEFEALLMSRPEVQNEERWAWLWDSSSVGGIWYRWRLWEILTNAAKGRPHGTAQPNTQYIFDRSAPWVAEHGNLPFEYTTEMDEFVSESDYQSSSDEDSGDEGRRRLQHLQGGPLPGDTTANAEDGPLYLNPLRKAKLVHLLSRLPDTNAKLRCGDVARITAFAIQHAGSGAEEVVDLLTTNVHTPFALASSRPRQASYEPDNREGPEEDKLDDSSPDPSALKLISLYLISDILSSSSTSGVRHAWRYRQLFEAALKKKRTFEHLGRLEKDLKWGRLRAEKWRRAIGSMLNLWEGWSVFTAAGQEDFAESFKSPPLTQAEKDQIAHAEQEARKADKLNKNRWKPVNEAAEDKDDPDGDQQEGTGAGADENVDGEPMDEDEDLDGVPMEDTDEEEDHGEQAAAQAPLARAGPRDMDGANEIDINDDAMEDAAAAREHELGKRRNNRPTAADMFDDSDEEES